ncbi:sensor histidine kinase [Foetidibacter luteolus]|uniref:sensor histidine kinase n=1 Tax=Foetidibacter luteolus TaxID=2608880 RepID=UPI00129BED12|nr:ATP-binding protein [Foetidibacter luteolus]
MENYQLEKRIEDLNRQLQTTIQDLEELQHALSHDLRAPLRAVIGFSSILKEEYSGQLDDEARRLIETIVTNSKKANHFIEELVSFSRLGRKHLLLQQVPMQKLAWQCIHELLTEQEQEVFDIVIGDLPDCYGDAVMLKEVWVQLLKNAIRYSSKKEQPSIEVNFTVADGLSVYVVKDKGAGFDMEYSHKLFHIFQRLHSNDEFEGTGTGLAIVKRIILKHGGSVWAEAVPNKGSSFYFTVPLQEQ